MDFPLSQSSSATLISKDEVSETETFCGPSTLQPLSCFLFPATSEITGFDMIHIISPEDELIEPTSTFAVAVIQGLDVGYFESWALASLHVAIVGAVYSFYRTL
ncbi:hypothetical protein BT96DRAFT_999496 [Gymnopus androsaceus JB14]|uniref:Uncharacterized protein n=1 Tax=Gymnopus androsaceus JB14 TaxID=1447944 RepID=A0A6A4H7S4_9AGAR|nr:hypothetical protein BT96DRAFT_999496 [Gymnopus androsaceus JB14]